MGNAHPNLAPYQPFATLDGAIVIAVGLRYWGSVNYLEFAPRPSDEVAAVPGQQGGPEL